MSQVVEIKVKVSNPEQRYVKKFLCYDKVNVDKKDMILSKFVQEAMDDFKGDVDDVNVNINMSW
jgi:hypothetical protein